ncbi:hypothetical protein KUCAC02_023757 [Chaenocephalus aceratus]|uniref:Uncharacterized protein n=1 Tax=Chaenocephalus aceratus TaxID=36190 RepID=A0ACB9WGF7_CHAAC|nr:hypothetical protein KUCAC02_023757 [Chaenocephalus aceratus]
MSCSKSDKDGPDPTILYSSSTRYILLDFVGEGCFGKVAKCVNLKTSESTAIKILEDGKDANYEVRMLQKIKGLHPDKNNLVRYMDNFMFQDKYCLAFEMLDMSIWDLYKQKQEPFSLNEIRPIAQQLLVAFEALKGIGIIHTDLKPDNVMLVNHKSQPFRIKLIDFGLALPASEAEVGMELQPIPFRAPEVTLGLPITEAIDMWSLGCLLAAMYFGIWFFPGASTYDQMRAICQLLGQPKKHLLDAGINTGQYFIKGRGLTPGWELMTPSQYKMVSGVQPECPSWDFDDVKDLTGAVMEKPEEHDYDTSEDMITLSEVMREDKMAFSDLLNALFNLDGQTRITPGQALEHSFVTMVHLEDNMYSNPHASEAFEMMDICTLDLSDAMCDPLSDPETDMKATDGDSPPESSRCAANSNTERPTNDTTSQADPCNPEPHNNESAPAPLQAQHPTILYSSSTRFILLDFVGEGCFGKVAKCVNLKTSETTAIKILEDGRDANNEVRMLQKIKGLHPDKNNLVRYMDNFMFQDKYCLAFEMLDMSIWDLYKQKQETFSLNEIRPIAQQLLVAFEALKGIGIIHTDLKPDNVMLVNHKSQPFRIKLIDFGLALPASEAEVGMEIQPISFRAPEVTLGLPITEAIDMWSLGCLLAKMYFGIWFFPGASTYDQMRAICQLLGQPKKHLLDAGINTGQYFIKGRGLTPGWELRTPSQYKMVSGVQPEFTSWYFDDVKDLTGAVMEKPEEHDYDTSEENITLSEVMREDKMAFSDLLNALFNLDGQTRITPGQALEHSFVTIVHLEDNMYSNPHASEAFEMMDICTLDLSDAMCDPLSDPSENGETDIGVT